MLTRQKIILRLLNENAGSCSKIQLTKLCFLLSKEGRADLKTFYEFVPYKFGPYSFTMAHELKSLEREGCITSETELIELTKKGEKLGRPELEVRLSRDIELLRQNYGKIGQEELVAFVYEKYPWYTANSQFPNKRKANIKKVDCANFTIGYQSFQVDGLLNKLLESGIQTLIDTRSNPISRKYGFHKSTLSKFSELVGIAYIHCPEVGIPSSWRHDIQSDAEFKNLFQRYKTEILSIETQTLQHLTEIIARGPSALLCREAEPGNCHRTVLAKELSKINKLPVIDLSPVAVNEDVSQIKFNKILMS